MSHRKRTWRSGMAAVLAALLLSALAGCGTPGTASPEAPTSSVEAEAPGFTPTPAPSESEPTGTPEPDTTEPPTSPEPEAGDPVTSPEPEVGEPAVSPEPEQTAPADDPPPETAEPSSEPEADPYGISAPRVGLYRGDTLVPIYEKAADIPMASASMSKIVTAITALHYVSPDTVFTVGTELRLVQPGASICLIGRGHRLTLEQLLYGLLLPSGCDAAYTIAVNVAREVSGNPNMSDEDAVVFFSELMNGLAVQLGAVNSHFVNPDGWDHPDHYTTVQDMAIFAACAMEYEVLRTIVSTPEKWVVFVSGENITWKNSNLMLHQSGAYYHPDVIGIKTGTTSAAGNCLLCAVEKDGALYIAVISGNPTKNGRYEDAQKLLTLIPEQ